MRVKMLFQITGTRDGEDWPAPGEVIDVPAEEAKSLLANKLATRPSPERKETAASPAAKARETR